MAKQEQNIENLASLQEELKYNKLYQKKDPKVATIAMTLKAKTHLMKSYEKYTKLLDNPKNTDTDYIDAVKKTLDFIVEQVEDKKYLINNKDTTLLKLEIDYSKNSYKNLKKEITSFVDIYNNKILMKKELGIKEAKYKASSEKYNDLKANPKPTNLYARNLRKAEIKNTRLRIRIKDLKEFIRTDSRSRKLYLSDEPALTPAGWAKLLLSYAFLLFWAVVIIWPIYELVKTTFNDASTHYLDATKFTFGTSAYSRLFSDTDYTSWLVNTLVISIATSLITVAFTLLMGYAFSRFRFKGKKMSLLSIMLLQMVPTLAALTVFYVLYTLLHESIKMDGRVVLTIIYIGGGIAGNTFIMKGYMDSISMEIDEAAKIDGLSQWRIFTRIIAPLTKPMIALVALWSFIGPFGDYILPGLLLSDSKDYTLAKGLQTLVNDPRNIDQPAFAAGAVITALPISILFISLRKFLVGGMTAGGVKG